MKFKLNKIAAAVAVSLGTSVVGMNAAQADQIFFPYVVLSKDVTTILTVINDEDEAVGELHYRYYRKQEPAGNTGGCNEFNFWDNTSENDVVTFDLGGVFGNPDSGVMFEPQQSKAVNEADFRMDAGARSPAKRGYVLVDNYSPIGNNAAVPSPTSRLSGEALVIEFATGSSWGYQAYNASEIWSFDGVDLVLENRYDFTDRVETNGDVLVAAPDGTDPAIAKANNWVPVAILPFDQAVTKFLVTPIGTAFPFQGPDGTSAYQATIRLTAATTSNDRVLYDRDERPFSGGRAVPVTCVGAVLMADLIDENVRRSAPSGGWSNLVVSAGQAVVMKAEYNPLSPSILDNVTINGSWNSVNWLRKGFRESLPRALGLGGWGAIPTYNIPAIDNNAPYPPLDSQELQAAGLPVLPSATAPLADYYKPIFAADPAGAVDAINNGRVFVNTSGAQ
jgi:hypothetical protein